MLNQENTTEPEELYEHHRIVVDLGQSSLRIDKYLASRIQNVSRTKIQNAALSDCILVNKKAVKSNYKIKPNDIISVVLPNPPVDYELLPEDIPLTILFEDDEILIVNKKAGMVVHPAYANYTGTLVNALLFHFQQENFDSVLTNEYKVGLVHRIDKDTSGILVIAKTDIALPFLAKQFFEHTITRKYLTLVWGDLKTEEGTIKANLLRDPKDRKKTMAIMDTDKGRNAVTHYKVIERFGYVTLLECSLETGRTHQIRAHMSFLGHPVFNDETYGGSEIRVGPSFTKYKQFVLNCFKLIPRQALHAKSLGFIHPKTKEYVFFDSELPGNFSLVLDKWRNYTIQKS